MTERERTLYTGSAIGQTDPDKFVSGKIEETEIMQTVLDKVAGAVRMHYSRNADLILDNPWTYVRLDQSIRNNKPIFPGIDGIMVIGREYMKAVLRKAPDKDKENAEEMRELYLPSNEHKEDITIYLPTKEITVTPNKHGIAEISRKTAPMVRQYSANSSITTTLGVQYLSDAPGEATGAPQKIQKAIIIIITSAVDSKLNDRKRTVKPESFIAIQKAEPLSL